MTDLGWGLQTAAYAHLAADPGVRAVLGDPPRIYDIAPARPDFPFAVFGEWRTSPLAGLPDAFEHDLRIRIYSRYEGRLEVREAMGAIHDALHDADLAPPGRSLVSLRFVFSDVFLRDSGRTWGGIMRFRAVDMAAS